MRALFIHKETQDGTGKTSNNVLRAKSIYFSRLCMLMGFFQSVYAFQVVRALDTMASTDLTNGMRVGESEMFNSAQQSAEIRLFRRMAFGSQDYSTGFFSPDSWSSEGNQVNRRTE